MLRSLTGDLGKFKMTRKRTSAGRKPAAKQSESAQSAAKYADTIHVGDCVEMMNAMPADSVDMVFADPTSTEQNADGGAFMFDGKDAVLKGLGDYAAQYKSFSVDYDIERRYESNGVVVFVAELTYNLVTNDDQTFSGAAPIVTAITVKDGKVVKHLDLYDYAGNAESFTD